MPEPTTSPPLTRELALEVQRQAAEIEEEYPEVPLDGLADEMEAKADVYDDGPEIAVLVAAELRRRAVERRRLGKPAGRT